MLTVQQSLDRFVDVLSIPVCHSASKLFDRVCERSNILFSTVSNDYVKLVDLFGTYKTSTNYSIETYVNAEDGIVKLTAQGALIVVVKRRKDYMFVVVVNDRNVSSISGNCKQYYQLVERISDKIFR